jgi:hypothetical protein
MLAQTSARIYWQYAFHDETFTKCHIIMGLMVCIGAIPVFYILNEWHYFARMLKISLLLATNLVMASADNGLLARTAKSYN